MLLFLFSFVFVCSLLFSFVFSSRIETIAHEISESDMSEALTLAQSSIVSLIDNQKKMFQELPAPSYHAKHVVHHPPQAMIDFVRSHGQSEIHRIFFNGNLSREQRSHEEGHLRKKLLSHIHDHAEFRDYPEIAHSMAVEQVFSDVIRGLALESRRVDGRSISSIRPFESHVQVLPTPAVSVSAITPASPTAFKTFTGVHGSSVFNRGETHVLCTATLGSYVSDCRVVTDPLFPTLSHSTYHPEESGARRDYFCLHYDFPAYATGEVGSATAPNRRMVGHGNLAEKALRPVIPDRWTFPYAIRIVSECTSSNGSSSMASVCGGTLALMDAGVPIKSPVAGISMGLVTSAQPSLAVEPEESSPQSYQLLTDILGLEDHYGDMDFKVAGTRRGITAIQLDVKLERGVPLPYLLEGLQRAAVARNSLLDKIEATIPHPRYPTPEYLPGAAFLAFDSDRKRHLVGPGGEMMRYLESNYKIKLTIEDESEMLDENGFPRCVAYLYGAHRQQVHEARRLVQDLACVVKTGDEYEAEVLDIKDYGLVLKLTRAQEAFLHVSELSHDVSVTRKLLGDVVTIGQILNVKVRKKS